MVEKVNLPKEKIDYTIDLIITMAVEEIACQSGLDKKEVLIDFLSSKTGEALYDADNRLWWSGPAYIAELYQIERKNKK